ncbi:aspartate/glutamate racemase family protein [Thalassococcus sp. S3]|uniref:aspartate/glutamate racemase family protein n=1 Tax=Thalassococcus sp. S3 TaxID=2017482 RepID=UPI0010248C90|nr:amino acid racemase [Thalassococcus sp. S3]QBF31023.1 aspartate racemase [Thalassococcus sp. S3]
MTPVGILGGMGPEATILLMQKVLAAVPARDDADHIPLIVHQNPQVPSRIAALIEGQGTDPGPVLAQMAHDLAQAGAKALAMPCNTAHHYASTVEDATPLPFLNMIELTSSHLAEKGAARVGMLASPAVRLTDAFGPSFRAQRITAVFPEDDAPVLSVIRAVKAGQPVDASLLVREMEKLAARGCDHILVACTELSLMVFDLPRMLPVTDSLDCLTSAIVRFARSAP